jgi:hypothetical protein
MSSQKYQQLVDFLSRHLQHLFEDGGWGRDLAFPSFDLMPFDYLEFAEEELEKNTSAARINCVGHLKRAVECELDTLLGVLHLTKHAQNFPKKLELVGAIGIVSPRSLAKLNKMRNRMEHEYIIPEFQELDIYFDLASSFIHTLEGFIFMLHGYSEMYWRRVAGDEAVSFRVIRHDDSPRVAFFLTEGGTSTELSFDVTTLSEYCEGLKVYFLMCRATALVSNDYVLSKLQDKSLYFSGRSQ